MSAVSTEAVRSGGAPGHLIPRAAMRTGFTMPMRFERDDQVKGLMLEALAQEASDIIITPELPVTLMVEGRLHAISNRVLDWTEVQTLLKVLAGRDTAVTDIVSGGAVNARYELVDPERRDDRGAKLRHPFRVNAAPIDHLGNIGAQLVLRAIPQNPPYWEDIGIQPELLSLMTPVNGIVYVSGITGSGKTTTLASVIRHVLEGDTSVKGNVLTAEEPIEFSFRNIHSKHSIITQSQIGLHFPSFGAAVREAMRRKPAMMMVGELRDEESIAGAVEMSNTGHTVMGTTHATSAAFTIRRLISRFPEEERSSVIYDIIESTRLIVAQRLVMGVNGRRVAAREYLPFTETVKERLADLDNMGKVTRTLKAIIEDEGHSFAKEADRLYAEGKIDALVAAELRAA